MIETLLSYQARNNEQLNLWLDRLPHQKSEPHQRYALWATFRR